MRRTLLVGTCLTITLTISGCQDSATAPTAARVAPAASRVLQSELNADTVLDLAELQLPSSARIADQDVINPRDYVCPASTDVTAWYRSQILDFRAKEPALYTVLVTNLLADLIPTYEALLFATTDTPQSFGYNGEYTRILQKAERDVKRFWDIPSADIQLIGLHGTVLLDVERTAQTYRTLFPTLSPATALAIAQTVRNAVLQSQTLNGGNHPIFSFNAFAASGGGIPDKIIMGDGVLAGFEAVGLGDVAPQAAYAHEFAHQIQFENGYFDDPFATAGSAAERTRYTELMADAYAAYYLTHKRGGTLNKKRVAQFLQVYYQLGDCAFTSSGHHGTPNQRLAAAQFGFALADQAQKQGHIMSSEQFHALFVAAYPQIIAPDAP